MTLKNIGVLVSILCCSVLMSLLLMVNAARVINDYNLSRPKPVIIKNDATDKKYEIKEVK